MAKVNLAGIEVGDFEALPKGFYPVRVSKYEEKSSKKGKPYISWEFTVSADHDSAGRKIWYNTSLQPQALWNLKRLLLAFGIDEEDLEGEIDLEGEEYIDSEFVVRVDHRQYQGKTQQDIVGVYPQDFDYESADVSEDDLSLNEGEELPFE